jgi:hypothetical protein
VLVCSVSCHYKVLKTERVVEDKAGKKWINDNPDSTKTFEVLLKAWLVTEGNYADYQGASGGGESKLAQTQQLVEHMQKSVSVPRKPKDITKKFRYHNTIDWKLHTGAGVESPGDIFT